MLTYRISRINKEFLRRISDMLQTRIKNEDVREAILTNVSVSRDLSFARVYYTLIDVKRKDNVQKALESAAGQVRAVLGKEMYLRTIPELHFIFDDSEVKAREMDSLLERVAKMDAEKKLEESRNNNG
jgi:ribosome-binding factor A